MFLLTILIIWLNLIKIALLSYDSYLPATQTLYFLPILVVCSPSNVIDTVFWHRIFYERERKAFPCNTNPNVESITNHHKRLDHQASNWSFFMSVFLERACPNYAHIMREGVEWRLIAGDRGHSKIRSIILTRTTPSTYPIAPCGKGRGHPIRLSCLVGNN